MARLIDTTVFIAIERQDLSLGALEAITDGQPFALASITASELLVGALHSTSLRQRRRLTFVTAVLTNVPVIPFDLESAEVHAQLSVYLSARGEQIGANDLLIAATAIAWGHEVLTHNVRHFNRVPGLRIQEATI